MNGMKRMQLVVDARPEHWQAFVYELAKCEAVYTAERMNISSAKFAAVDFAAMTRFGPGHDLKIDVVKICCCGRQCRA